MAEVTRKMGISEQTFYRWKKKFGGLLPSEVRKLRQLEEENARLRRLVADLSLDKEMLQEVIRKSYKACSTAEDGHKNTSPLLFPFQLILWGIVWGMNFEAKRKGPLEGLNLLILFGGRWATRTPDLWFRRTIEFQCLLHPNLS